MKKLLIDLKNDYAMILKKAFNVFYVIAIIGLYMALIYPGINIVLLGFYWITERMEFTNAFPMLSELVGYIFMIYLAYKLMNFINRKINKEVEEIEEENNERTREEV